MVWLLLTTLILLAQQYHFLWQDRNEERTVKKVLLDRIDLIKDQREYHRRVADRRLRELAEDSRYQSAIEQAQIWSARAIKLGFYRRQHKNAVRNARRSNKD